MRGVRLLRTLRFRAEHHYGHADWTAERNREAFGGQVRSHAHDWNVTVTVVGPPDEATGFVVDLRTLDRALRDVVGPLDGADLNEVIPEVRCGDMQPSTENLARWLFERLEPRIVGGARLERVRVAEGPDLAGEFPGE